MRNRILAVVLVAGCVVSTLAHALGLGDIEVYSALNQPLVAEIELSSVRPGETDNMRVKLADEDAFLQAGVERPFYLTRLKFNLAVKPDGTQYIQVTTQDPIREPFLNFLVDVDWPRGRLVREYTVLLDPPVFAGAGQAPVTQAETPPVASSTSVAGAPALIERDQSEVSDDDFEFEELPADPLPLQSGQIAATDEAVPGDFDTASDAFEEDFGSSETAAAAGLSADLPDIEISASDDAAVAESQDDLTYDDETAKSDDAVDDSAGPAYVDSEESYLDDGDVPVYPEDSPADQPVFSAGGIDTPLPDINLFYDASLPYDEAGTNALLAQFAAEDAARVRGEGVSLPGAEDGNEHLVADGDTMYGIASRYKAPDVSVNQAMLSILRYNPDAFIRDNINSVKKGFVLRIPDRESMLRIDSAEALAEVRQQYALWREYRNQLAGAPSTARDAQSADDLYVSESTSTSERDASGELSILSPGRDAESSDRASGAQEGSEGGSSLYVDLQLAREQLQAERLEKTELQARLTELTAQIETQDRIISVQSEQLAQLQQRLAELGEQSSALSESEPAADGTVESETSEAVEPETSEAVELETSDEQPAETTATDADEFRPGLTLQGGTDEEQELADDTPIETTPSDAETGRISPAEERAASRYGLDFEEDFEPALDGESPLTLQPGDQAPGETESVAGSAADAEVAIEDDQPAVENPAGVTDESVPSAQGRPEGLVAYIYDYLPPPYNLMAIDFLETTVEVPVVGSISIAILLLGGIGAFLLLLVWLAIKPKKKKPVKKAPPVIEVEPAGDKQDVHFTVQPAKPSFGERVNSLFAPITGLFGGGKKPSGIAAIAAQADHSAAKTRKGTEYPKEEADLAGEEFGEIESFDETAKTAAEQARSDTGGRFASTQKSAPAAGVRAAPVQEEVSDDTTQEADVYLAYGLHDQAEELLTHALATSPGKIEYQGKLLETYFAAGKRSEFESLAQQLRSKLAGRSSRIWDKAIAMGKEIAPDNPLFTAVADTGLKVSDFAPARPETADLDLSESQGSMMPDLMFGEDEGATSTTTDFDLGLDEGVGELDDTFLIPPGGGKDDKTQIMSKSELDELDASMGRRNTELQFDLAADADEMASDLNIDFNADELGLDTEIDVDTSMDDMAHETQFDDDATVAMEMPFNLDDESGMGSDVDAIELDAEDVGDISLEDVDSNVFEADGNAGDDLLADLDRGSGASVNTEFEIPEDDDTLIDADLDDETISGDMGDEVSTKLDLARAYMDMGDYDGASSTLEEVMAEGDAAQRKEAEELLEQIH